MAILSSLKSLLGLADDGPGRTESEEPADIEPAAESERAVKSPVSELESQPGADATGPSDRGRQPVDSISGIGPTYREKLAAAGINSVDELAAADAATLASTCDVSQGRVAEWVDRANDR